MKWEAKVSTRKEDMHVCVWARAQTKKSKQTEAKTKIQAAPWTKQLQYGQILYATSMPSLLFFDSMKQLRQAAAKIIKEKDKTRPSKENKRQGKS